MRKDEVGVETERSVFRRCVEKALSGPVHLAPPVVDTGSPRMGRVLQTDATWVVGRPSPLGPSNGITVLIERFWLMKRLPGCIKPISGPGDTAGHQGWQCDLRMDHLCLQC